MKPMTLGITGATGRLGGRIATRLATFWGAGAHADDVVQEAFVKAYFALDRFREGAPFRPW